jgi:hypothetical protein
LRLDPIATRRFGELLAKGEAVLAAKTVNFVSREDGTTYYDVPSGPYREWVTNALNLIQRTFGESSIHFKHLSQLYADFGISEYHFAGSFSLFKAAKEDYEGGYLFNVRTLAKAEILADAMGQAKELVHAGYKDPACILARVSLEAALKDLCDQHNIPHAKLDKMNGDLCKANVYNMAKQKLVTAWSDIGNKAAHGDWSSYTLQDAAAMVQGVEALVADL